MARFTLLIFIILGSIVTSFGQSSQSLQGTVTDVENGEPLMFATVALKKGGQLITGAQTDFDGKYSFNNINAGEYDVEVSYVGYSTKTTSGVVIYAGKSLTLNIKMAQGIELEEIVVTYTVPLVEQDNTTQGTVVTSKEIDKLASKNINGIIAQSAGVSSTDDGGAISIRGSRSSATDYYIDGIRVSGSMIPQSEIEQLQVITGGIPASIGDVTGGVISVTTKGPSRKFNGTAELETSELLDGYQYRLAMLSLSGPLLKNDKGESIIGYRFSGQYRSNADRSPSALGVYKVKDDVYDRLSEDPLVQISSGGSLVPVPAANFLTEDDVELVKTRPTSDDVRYDANGKFDIRLNKNMDIAIGGSFIHNQAKPTSNSLLNYNRNRTEYSTDARGFFRFRHRIGGATTASDADKASTGTSIQNASYTLQMSYNLSEFHTSDPIHGDNLFNYGYIGEFQESEIPVWETLFDTLGNPIGRSHIGNLNSVDSYTPSEINAPLTNYNKFVTDFDQFNDFPYFNGNRPEAQMSVYNLHTNVNDIYNGNSKSNNQRYQFNAKGLFEIVPSGDSKGKHTIEFGIMYEQRMDRFYAIAPRSLWTIARQLTNSHFNSLDFEDSIGVFDPGNGILITQYANLAQDAEWASVDPENRTDGQSYFDKQLRAALGADRKERISIDELSPDQLSLSYFAATDLISIPNTINYNGYDYLGNPLGGDVSFNDFFLDKNADGEYTRKIAPNQPIYTAAYVEDKFLFKDIIFRIGLRVDRYDANTKTLKDQYSLYDAYTASEFGGTIPGAVSEDAVVYTSDGLSNSDSKITAYRDGETWYTAEGSEVNSPISIFGVDRALPALVSDTKIKEADFDPNSTFVDAEPTINWMPRLAFSFPISEDANFFAHYDVLAQRPPSNTLATPMVYYNFTNNIQQANYQFNNPSLRPERTIDYEVGFQQKLSESSAIKMSVYYKELRDMIQSQSFLYAFPSNYEGFGNQDFGTVKGFNFSYDMRRTGNVTLRATYTLQFAEGTGSDANSQRGVSNRGNLRVIYPLSFDERHRVTGTIDYRYKDGNKYNGPTISGKQIFANAGINLTVIGASGRPYTASLIAEERGGSGTKGGINGARLPWSTTLNMRIDKDFTLVEPSKDAKGMFLNVYFRVQNLLDQRNVIGVYSFTGSAEDDGYLASPRGQAELNNAIDPSAYYLSYQWRLLNPGFYTLPRRMYVGATINF